MKKKDEMYKSIEKTLNQIISRMCKEMFDTDTPTHRQRTDAYKIIIGRKLPPEDA